MRGKILTEEQKSIILANQTKWADEICRMDGMDGVTTRQVKDYLKRHEQRTEEQTVIEVLEDYIKTHGLPRQYGVVIDYLNYLKR